MALLGSQKLQTYVKRISSDMETPASVLDNQHDVGLFVTQIGLYSNLFMATAKGIFGYAFNSKAMMADAVHGVTDLTSDIVSLITVYWSLKTPDKKFPNGYRKIECLGTLAVSSILMVGGVGMSYNAVSSLSRQLFPGDKSDAEFHNHNHTHLHAVPDDYNLAALSNMCVLVLSVATIGIKEWLYHATIKVAKDRNSSILAANAIHHRIDSFTEIVLICVVLSANLIRNATWLDAVGGLFISFMTIKPAAHFAYSALCELSERGIDN
ncbi:hypothetical protein FDECE_11424 [Fusarium decemcellulare]|nr:hypothetical protein FDECE_11424 [Fusarium decemcellulare]